jgi:hypothetical protein
VPRAELVAGPCAWRFAWGGRPNVPAIEPGGRTRELRLLGLPREKGAAICGNGLVISERKLNRAVIDELRKLLASKEIQTRFVDGFTKRLQHEDSHDDRERAALEAEVTAQESRVRNVTAAIARSGFSEALAEQVGLEEETLRSLRQRLAAKLPAGDWPGAAPDSDAVARFLENVLEIAESAPRLAASSR